MTRFVAAGMMAGLIALPIGPAVAAPPDGKPVTARVVYSPDYETEGEFGERIWSGGHYSAEATAALTQALHAANAALIAQLRAP